MSYSPPSFGELRYGSFYLPVLGYAFLYFKTGGFGYYLKLYDYAELSIVLTISELVLFFLMALSLVGAMEIHGIARLIFGSEGPERKPKTTRVAKHHFMAIIIGINPDRIPLRGGIIARSKFGQTLTLVEFINMMFRFPVFIPTFLYKYLTYGSIILLLLFAGSNPIGLLGGVIILSLIIFLTQGTVWAILPSMISQEASQSLDVPEYRKRYNNTLTKSKRRIGRNSRSIRYSSGERESKEK